MRSFCQFYIKKISQLKRLLFPQQRLNFKIILKLQNTIILPDPRRPAAPNQRILVLLKLLQQALLIPGPSTPSEVLCDGNPRALLLWRVLLQVLRPEVAVQSRLVEVGQAGGPAFVQMGLGSRVRELVDGLEELNTVFFKKM